MRYVWGAVGVSMVFVVIVWIFSIITLFQRKDAAPRETNNPLSGIQQQYQDLKQNSPSLKDYANQPLSSGTEGVSDSGSSNFTNPDQNQNSDGSQDPTQSSQYSSIQSGTIGQ